MEKIPHSGRGRAQCPVRARPARPWIKGTAAATAEHAGTGASQMSRIRNIRTVLNYNGNGEIADLSALKPTSARARVRRKTSHKLRAQAGSLSLQAPRSGNQGTSVQAGPGHKQQG